MPSVTDDELGRVGARATSPSAVTTPKRNGSMGAQSNFTRRSQGARGHLSQTETHGSRTRSGRRGARAASLGLPFNPEEQAPRRLNSPDTCCFCKHEHSAFRPASVAGEHTAPSAARDGQGEESAADPGAAAERGSGRDARTVSVRSITAGAGKAPATRFRVPVERRNPSHGFEEGVTQFTCVEPC